VDSQSSGLIISANFAGMTQNSEKNTFQRPFLSNQEIGRRIRKARKARGWTIAQMAEVGQIKAVVIGSYERGSRNMPLSRIGELATILNVDLSYLLGLEPVTQSVTQSVTSSETGNFNSAVTIDLRAISRPRLTHSDWLAQLVKYCGGIVKARNDWNGEVLSLRASDLEHLSFAIGASTTEIYSWLGNEKYLITGINRP